MGIAFVGVLLGLEAIFGTANAVAIFNAMMLSLVMAGANYVIGKITSAIRGKPTIDNGRQVAIRQANAPRRIIIGRARVAGVVTFVHLYNETTHDILHLIFTVAGHEIQQYVMMGFDDIQVPQASPPGGGLSGPVSGPYAGFAWVEYKEGSPGEAPFQDSQLAPMGWTSAHKQEGCASAHVSLYWNADKYGNGVPNISWDTKGKLLYDPRSSTTVYSENPALAIRWYLTDKEFGLGCDASEIDDASVIASANICDENVTLDAGGTEKRYTCNGVFDSDNEPGSILEALALSMAGYVVYSQGKWFVLAGAYDAPTVTLTDRDLRGPIQVQTLRSKRDLANSIRGTFYDPARQWQKTDFPAVVNDFYVAEDSGYPNTTGRGAWATGLAYSVNETVNQSGATYVSTVAHTSGSTTKPGVGASWATVWAHCAEIIWQDVDLPFTVSAATCQRLAKIILERLRRQTTITLRCKMGAYRVQPGDTFKFTHARFGWTDKTFIVLQSELVIDAENDAPVLGVDIQAQETDGNVFGWTHEEIIPVVPVSPVFPRYPHPKPDLSDGSIVKKGSNPPTMAEGMTTALTTTSITWNWNYTAGHGILRTDQALTETIPLNAGGSQAVTGLTSGTTYDFYPYYNERTGNVEFVAGGHGTPSWAHTHVVGGDRLLVQEQQREDHFPLSLAALQQATTTSGTGTGGGGGDGGCLATGMKVRVKDNGVIDVGLVREGDELWSPTGFTKVREKLEKPHDVWIECEFSNGAKLVVTSGHPFEMEQGGVKLARQLTLEDSLRTPTGITFARSLHYLRETKIRVTLTLDEPHTFYASADGENWVLAHNGPYQTT
jgi:hypothetical protein